MRNDANTDTVDVYIDGYIVDAPTQEIMREWWGDNTSVSYKSVRDQILKANPKTVNYYVNSGGGQVADAMAIHDFNEELERKGVTVNRYGRGIIASAATYILMAKRKENCYISENSFFMIHNVSGGVWGDVNDIENYAKTMRKFNDLIRDFYATATGKSANQVEKWMNQETWFTGTEAVENGFVGQTTEAAEFTNTLKVDSWPYSNKAVLNTYNSFVHNNNSDMKFEKKTIDKIVDAVKKALNIGTDTKTEDIKPDNIQNAIVTGVTNGLEAVADELETMVNTAIEEALGGKDGLTDTLNSAIATVVANTIKTALEDKGTIANAISTATTNLVTKEELENLQKDLANKVGTPGGKNKGKKKVDPEDKYDHEGIEWGPKGSGEEDDDDEDDE